MKRIHLAILLTAWAGVLSACGSSSSSSGGGAGSGGGTDTGSSAASGSASASGTASGTANCPAVNSAAALDGGGATISIGSKSFAEEQIAAEIAKQVLAKHNYTVTYTVQEADPNIGKDQQAGKIDLLWQYTGTELGTYDAVDKVPSDLHQAFTQAQKADDSKGLCWIGETPMNDTNGIAIRQADVATFGSTLSDFTTYLKAHSNLKVCIMSEFKSRPDGVPGLQAAYGDVWGTYAYTELGKTAEASLAKKDCDAGEVFTTDSGISANSLVGLKDDKGVFPADNLGLIVRSDVLKAHPGIAAIINPIAAKLTTDQFLALNKQVEIDGKKPADVAAAWLAANGG